MEDEVVQNRALPPGHHTPARRGLQEPALAVGLPAWVPQAWNAHGTQPSIGYPGCRVDDICVFGEVEGGSGAA